MRGYLHWVEVGRPALNVSGAIHWGGNLNELKGESEPSTNVCCPLLPDCSHEVSPAPAVVTCQS